MITAREDFTAWAETHYRNSDEYTKRDFDHGLAAWQAALATQPQAPQGAVTVPRSLALKTWGFLAQDCSPCAHEECQIDGKNIGVDGLATEWFALVKVAPETPEGDRP